MFKLKTRQKLACISGRGWDQPLGNTNISDTGDQYADTTNSAVFYPQL